MMGAIARFERSMIRERVNAGLKRARAQGKKLGRPRVAAKVEDAVKASLAAGTGILRTARTLRIAADQGRRRASEAVVLLSQKAAGYRMSREANRKMW
jgi:DNA invertase Pin-like site-specific DNA recombinase